MLRKHTTFFDPSLENLDHDQEDVLEPYKDAFKLCSRLTDLIRDISLAPSVFFRGNPRPDSCLPILRNRLEACSEGMGMTGLGEGNDAVSFWDACRIVYRLETVFRYLWEQAWNGNTKRREMHLDINFYRKGAKQPYYRMQFWLSNAGGIRDVTYWGEWPAPKVYES